MNSRMWSYRTGLLLAALLPLATLRSSAFTSTQIETVSAFVLTGGSTGGGGEELRIQHAPLSAISDITREMVILTEVGNEIPPGQVSYNSRLTPLSDFGPLPSRSIRLRVFYRFIDPASQDPLPTPLETSVIEGPDPLAAAFEIPSNSVNGPVLQYRITAERIQYQGNQLIVLSTFTLPATTPQEPDPFFSVGVQANALQVMGVNGGRFSIDDGNPADGETSVDIPSGLLPGDTTITIDELPTNSPLVPPGLSQPITVYRFDSNPKINGLMRVSLLYPDFEFPRGQDGLVDGTDIPETNLAVMWWDGFAWRKLGQGLSSLNSLGLQSNTLTTNVGTLNYMAIVAAAGALSAQERRPTEKIMTPNGDGVADVVNFVFGDRTDNVKVEIFDVTGHRVRTLMSQSSLQWDGRDESGGIVESGVYIYQYSIDGTRVSGLVAVAK